MNVKEYLSEHSVAEIRIGQSGADVYEIDGKYVLKHADRKKTDEEQFAAYTREVFFYQYQMTRQKRYLPEVLKADASENEILILMKKYDRPDRNAINAELIQKITRALAKLHTDEAPSFMLQKQGKAEPMSGQRIEECLSGWKCVLEEHPGAFDESQLEEIAGKINEIIMQDIIWHMNAANVITSFAFWHEYLHGSSAERVQDIYGKMIQDFKECSL